MEKENKETEDKKPNEKSTQKQIDYMLNLIINNNLQKNRIEDLMNLVDDQKETIGILEKALKSRENQNVKLLKLIESIKEMVSKVPFIGKHILRKINSTSLLLDNGKPEKDNTKNQNLRKEIETIPTPVALSDKQSEKTEEQKLK